jgi:sugar phosphate isomerase/epimerase
MYPGISTQVFGGRPLCAQHVRAIRESGFSAAEIYGMPPHFDLLDESKVAEAAVFFKGEGVRVSAVHAPYKAQDPVTGRMRRVSPASDDPDVMALTEAHVSAALRAAEIFDAPTVVFHCGAYGDRMSGSTVSNCISFFTMFETRLAGGAIKIALENIATKVSAPVYISYLINKFKLDHYGICLDVAHANIGSDPAKSVTQCGGRLLHVHVSDNFGKEDKHAIPFEGNINWFVVMSSLKEIGYEGCLNFEPRGPELPEVMLGKCRDVYDLLLKLD